MARTRVAATLLAAWVAIMVTAPSGDLDARGRRKAKAGATSKPKRAPALTPKGLHFGMTRKKVTALYDRVIDRDYAARFKITEPGIQMQRLEEEVRQRKQYLRMNYVKLDASPSPLDGTKFVGEYSFGNHEAYMKLKRRGKRRYLFFIPNRPGSRTPKLWKVIDVYRLKEGSKWGTNFDDAVKRISKKLRSPGHKLKADPDAGRMYPEVEWVTGRMHLRALNWGKRLGLAYEDIKILEKLDSLRTAKPKKEEELDPEVKKILR